MDVWPSTPVAREDVALKSWHSLLRVLSGRGVKGDRIDRISKVEIIRADSAEVVSRLHALVGPKVHIHLRSRAEYSVEIFAQQDRTSRFSVWWSETVKVGWRMKRNWL